MFVEEAVKVLRKIMRVVKIQGETITILRFADEIILLTEGGILEYIEFNGYTFKRDTFRLKINKHIDSGMKNKSNVVTL